MIVLQAQFVRPLPATACLTRLPCPEHQRGVLTCNPRKQSSSLPSHPARQRRSRVHSGRVVPAVALFGAQKLAGFGGEVFIAGGTSPLALQITKQLLAAGVKVAAGVEDLEAAQGLLEFAKRFELVASKTADKLRLIEIDTSDEEGLAASLPGRATVVLLPGDSPNGLDSRAGPRILSAAQEAGAGKVVLVQPKGGGGGGGFFGLFGGGGPNLEQEVANSGLQFVIVRTAKQAQDIDPAELGSISLGPQSSLPGGSAIAKSQVAEVVAAVVQQASDDVLVETWAERSAGPSDLASLVSQVLPQAVVQEEASVSEPEPEPLQEAISQPSRAGKRAARAASQALPVEQEAPAPSPKPSFFGSRKTAEAEPEPPKPSGGLFGLGKKPEPEKEEAPKKASGGLFGLGGGKKQIEEPPAKSSPGGFFGGRKAREPEPQEKPKGGLFGLGGGKKQVEDSRGNGKPSGGLFGGRRAKDEQASPSIGGARKAADRKVASAKRGGSAPRPGRGRSEPGPEVKTGGFLSALGLGATEYVEDE